MDQPKRQNTFNRNDSVFEIVELRVQNYSLLEFHSSS